MIYKPHTIWLVILLGGALTYGLRASFVVGMDYFKEPNWLQRFLRYVPAAVLSALIFAGLFIKGGSLEVNLLDPRYPATAVAAFVAWRTKNMLWTIVSGMAALWLGQWLLGWMGWA